MKIRSFIALPLSEETASSFFEVAEALCGLEHFHKIRWLPPENCHMTMAFLGYVETERLDRLGRHLEQSLSDQAAGVLRFCEVSPFPFNSRPRVIAALAEPSDWLKTLQSQCVQAARRSGIALERRRFTPHVTLARLNGRKKQTPGLPPLFMEKEIPVEHVVLFESLLHPEGAEYQVLEAFDLE